jgi:ElaB/YqjD/DUF883 family membrane-anchored ribosome-binding protein
MCGQNNIRQKFKKTHHNMNRIISSNILLQTTSKRSVIFNSLVLSYFGSLQVLPSSFVPIPLLCRFSSSSSSPPPNDLYNASMMQAINKTMDRIESEIEETEELIPTTSSSPTAAQSDEQIRNRVQKEVSAAISEVRRTHIREQMSRSSTPSPTNSRFVNVDPRR